MGYKLYWSLILSGDFGELSVCVSAVACRVVFLKDIEVGKGIKRWLKSTRVLEQEELLRIPLARVIKEIRRHVLGA